MKHKHEAQPGSSPGGEGREEGGRDSCESTLSAKESDLLTQRGEHMFVERAEV